jgi:transcriptional regulator with XRE-family HTH domain
LTIIDEFSITLPRLMALKETLERLGLRQTEFARLLDVSPRTVSLWATGDTPVPGPVLAYLRVLQSLSAESLAAELDRLEGRSKMLDEGIYRIEYRGDGGTGYGTLVLRNGKLAGTDVAGGSYEGTYLYDPTTELNNISLQMKIPPGGSLVTGLSAGPKGATIPIAASFKRATPKSVSVVDVAGNRVEVHLTYQQPLPN